MVERYAKCDALDMTWVRFRSIRNNIKVALGLEQGKPLGHADHIAQQQAEKEGDE